MTTPAEDNRRPYGPLTGVMEDVEGILRWGLHVVQIALGVCLGILLFLWVAANYVHTELDQIHPTFPKFPTTTTTAP